MPPTIPATNGGKYKADLRLASSPLLLSSFSRSSITASFFFIIPALVPQLVLLFVDFRNFLADVLQSLGECGDHLRQFVDFLAVSGAGHDDLRQLFLSSSSCWRERAWRR